MVKRVSTLSMLVEIATECPKSAFVIHTRVKKIKQKVDNGGCPRCPKHPFRSAVLHHFIAMVSIKVLGHVRLCKEITLGYMNVS